MRITDLFSPSQFGKSEEQCAIFFQIHTSYFLANFVNENENNIRVSRWNETRHIRRVEWKMPPPWEFLLKLFREFTVPLTVNETKCPTVVGNSLSSVWYGSQFSRMNLCWIGFLCEVPARSCTTRRKEAAGLLMCHLCIVLPIYVPKGTRVYVTYFLSMLDNFESLTLVRCYCHSIPRWYFCFLRNDYEDWLWKDHRMVVYKWIFTFMNNLSDLR